MKKPNIILIGGGGHCKACIDVIEQENKYIIAGIIDLKKNVGQKILGYPIIGSDEDLPEIANKHDHFLITIGQIKTSELRQKLFQTIKKLNKLLPTIISPLAHVSKHTSIGEGTIIMHHVLINSASTIGTNCIVNTKALIEHDVVIKNNCHISTRVTINGNCNISDNSFIGSGTTINQGVNVAKYSIIGSTSLILKHIKQENETWVGNPAKMKS